jgi:cbb3-type cytochrome oxidase cytochrome c subunit
MFESKSGVLLIAGLGFFALAFLANAVVPWLMYKNDAEQTVEEMVNANVLVQFQDLYRRYPEAFTRYFGAPPPFPDPGEAGEERPAKYAAREEFFREKCAAALRQGRDIYVGEACWHCHSQFVRPVSNESRRWGPVAKSWEYNNELQRPVMFGTRRVGPDLSREGGRRGNDWHFIHFYRPRQTTPASVMPDYPWFFEGSTVIEVPGEDGRPQRVEGPTAPNQRGFAIITYMQWLGSWLDSYPHYQLGRSIAR